MHKILFSNVDKLTAKFFQRLPFTADFPNMQTYHVTNCKTDEHSENGD